MTEEKYVKSIVKKVKCSGRKRKEIKAQLLSDISMAKENGESLASIMERMGSCSAVAGEFNENMTPLEVKKYKRSRNLKLVGLIPAILILFCLCIYWLLPKAEAIEKGGVFKESLVKAQMENVITWVGEDDYEQLEDISISVLKPTFEGNTFPQAKASISEDWGEFKSYGKFYFSQIKQQGKTYAVGQVTVNYENTNVTYTITFDKDLNLAGLYIQ